MSRHQRSGLRRGFTLRELSIAMAMGSVVMMTSVQLIHHAFDWTAVARDRRMDDQTFFRFSDQLRRDVHMAREMESRSESDDSGERDNASAWRITLSDGTDIDYRIVGRTVTRVESDGDDVVRREVYRFKVPRRISIHRLSSDDQWQLDVRTLVATKQQSPLWRSLRFTPGLRLRHERGEVQ